MNYFLPYGLIWHPSSYAIWAVPLNLLFVLILIRAVYFKLYGNKFLLIVYSLGIVYNFIAILSDLTYLDLHISNSIFNDIWYINIALILYEGYLSSKRKKKGINSEK